MVPSMVWPFPTLRLERRLEHRGEVFIGFAHGALLVVGG
jgi:hypothetical protein